MKKKILLSLTFVTVLFLYLAISVNAASTGNCGKNVKWSYDNSYTLTISGTGEMDDYSYFSAPFRDIAPTLKKVIIKEGVTSIGSNAFIDCGQLESIEIPNSIMAINEDAFSGCSSLSDVYISDLVSYLNIDFKSYPMAYAEKLYVNKILVEGDVEIPNGIVKIPAYAFCNCNGITSITIPKSVENVGDSAFLNCSSLTMVNLNAINCLSMGSSSHPVFKNCNALTTINVGNEVNTIPQYAFYNCRGITSIIISESVISIASYAFYNCVDLADILLPDNVKKINSFAFYGCESLSNMIIPESVTEIGTYAFANCYRLTTLNYNAINCITMGSSSNPVFKNCNSLKKVSIGNNVKTIPADAFYGCEKIESVYITDLESYLNIDYENYYSCPMVYGNSIYLNENSIVGSVEIPNTITKIPSCAFKNCNGIITITIPDSVISIDYSAFSGCSELTNLTIPENVENIGSDAFSGCTGLINLVIPDKVETIGSNAFSGCTGLTSLTIPDNVETIGYNVFSGCTGLTSLIIPDNVKNIGYGAFSGCTSLTSIIMPSIISLPEMFSNNIPDALIKVTISSQDIPNGFASECSNIARVNITDNVSSIGESAFKGCTNLRFLTLGQGLKKISQNAFDGCSNIAEITLPPSLQTIEQNAFNNCYSLDKIVIPESVTSIVGDGVFPKRTVIYGYRGSAAQEYAENYGYTFKEVDADEYITASNAERINDTIVISTSVKSDISKNILHIALYDNNNTLVDYMLVPTKKSKDNAYVVFKNNPNVSYAKVYIWDSMKTMTPTAKAEKVVIQ